MEDLLCRVLLCCTFDCSSPHKKMKRMTEGKIVNMKNIQWTVNIEVNKTGNPLYQERKSKKPSLQLFCHSFWFLSKLRGICTLFISIFKDFRRYFWSWGADLHLILEIWAICLVELDQSTMYCWLRCFLVLRDVWLFPERLGSFLSCFILFFFIWCHFFAKSSKKIISSTVPLVSTQLFYSAHHLEDFVFIFELKQRLMNIAR